MQVAGRWLSRTVGALLAVTPLLLLPTGSPATPAPAAVVHDGGHQTVPGEAELCQQAVSALLASELLQVTAGRPDAGAATRDLIAASLRDRPELLDRVRRAQQSLLDTADADLLGRYAMGVTAEVAGYQPRIVELCG